MHFQYIKQLPISYKINKTNCHPRVSTYTNEHVITKAFKNTNANTSRKINKYPSPFMHKYNALNFQTSIILRKAFYSTTQKQKMPASNTPNK